MFNWKWSRRGLQSARHVLWALVAGTLVALWYYWTDVQGPLRTLEPLLKIIGYVIGPLFAIIGFFTSALDKIEIKEQATALGAAQKSAEVAKRAADIARQEASEKAAAAEKLKRELEGVTKGADTLWNLRPPREFSLFRSWYHGTGARVISFCNLKGGVGKTTLATNYAAYVSETLHKNVLVVDLDYQGSLSNMLLLAIGREDIKSSRVDTLFAADANLATLQQAKVHLVPLTDQTSTKLPQAWLVPAGLTFARLENQLLLDWLLDQSDRVDVRYRLAHALLDPTVRNDYDLIIFDLPPRMTIGAINALVASQFFFVPTLLDGLSVEAIPQMLQAVGGIKKDLDLRIEFAGVIGTMTLADGRGPKEEENLGRAAELVTDAWTTPLVVSPAILDRTLPRRVAFSNVAGNNVALLTLSNSAQDVALRDIMHTLFADMSKRIGLLST